MDNVLEYTTDLLKKDEYLQKVKRRNFLIHGTVSLVLLSIIISFMVLTKEAHGVGAMMVIFMFIIAIFFYGTCRRRIYYGIYAESKFKLSNNDLVLISSSRRKKRILFNQPITVKTVYLGTYVLKGKYNWTDYHLSRRSPLSIPTWDSDIFIPLNTSNYHELIRQIKIYANVR